MVLNCKNKMRADVDYGPMSPSLLLKNLVRILSVERNSLCKRKPQDPLRRFSQCREGFRAPVYTTPIPVPKDHPQAITK